MDNRSAELATWDMAALTELLTGRGPADLVGTGFTSDDLAILSAGAFISRQREDEGDGHPEDDEGLWPLLAFRVPPLLLQRFRALPGKSDTDRLGRPGGRAADPTLQSGGKTETPRVAASRDVDTDELRLPPPARAAAPLAPHARQRRVHSDQPGRPRDRAGTGGLVRARARRAPRRPGRDLRPGAVAGQRPGDARRLRPGRDPGVASGHRPGRGGPAGRPRIPRGGSRRDQVRVPGPGRGAPLDHGVPGPRRGQGDGAARVRVLPDRTPVHADPDAVHLG